MDFCLYLPVLCTLFKSADHNVSLYKDLYLIFYLMNVNQILNLSKQFSHLPFIHSLTHTHASMNARVRAHGPTHTSMHARVRAHGLTHTSMHARAHGLTHTSMHARTNMNVIGTNIFFHALVYGNVNNTEKAMVMIIACQTT